MNLSSAKFVKSCPTKKDFLLDKRQVCFIGKSNVGKSSLINSLCQNKKLVYVSKTPGCTKMLNFFLIEERYYLVDAPGYGYYKNGALDFEVMILDYLALSTKCLRKCYILLDSRRDVSKDDLAVISMFEDRNIEYAIVFTKYDKLNQSEKAKAKKECDKYFANHEVFFTSSEKNIGLSELRGNIALSLN